MVKQDEEKRYGVIDVLKKKFSTEELMEFSSQDFLLLIWSRFAYIVQKIKEGDLAKHKTTLTIDTYSVSDSKKTLDGFDIYDVWVEYEANWMDNSDSKKQKLSDGEKKESIDPVFKLGKRHLKSLYKYAQFVNKCLEFIFEEEALEKLYESFPYFDISDSEFKAIKPRENINAVLVEGFVGDGKSSFITGKGSFDSEICAFWRANCRDTGKPMDHDFIPCFALLGLFGSLYQYMTTPEIETLYIDRSWISHFWFFEKGAKTSIFKQPIETLLEDEFRIRAEDTKEYNRYMNSDITLKLLISLSKNASECGLYRCQIYIKPFDTYTLPWPFDVTKRKMEHELYECKEDLEEAASAFYKSFVAHTMTHKTTPRNMQIYLSCKYTF